MRLINASTHKIEEFIGSNAPNYIALSHTWDVGREPSFQDWKKACRHAGASHLSSAISTPVLQDEPRHRNCMKGFLARVGKKQGFNKIHRFLRKLREGEKLNYGWVDTVCIDKTSSAELSEGINSMLRTYQECQKCLAYLADFTQDKD